MGNNTTQIKYSGDELLDELKSIIMSLTKEECKELLEQWKLTKKSAS